MTHDLRRENKLLRKALQGLLRNAMGAEDYSPRGTYNLKVTGRAVADGVRALEETEHDQS